MPFQSEKQRRYLWANEPEIAREWTDRYGASQGGLTRLPFYAGTGEEMIAMGTPLTNQMAKVYDKNALTGVGAESGFFGANDQLEALEDYYNAATDYSKSGLGKHRSPSEIRDYIDRAGGVIGLGVPNIDMNLIPKDFLENKRDYQEQKSPYDLIKGDQSSLTNEYGYPLTASLDLPSGNTMFDFANTVSGLNRNTDQGIGTLDLSEFSEPSVRQGFGDEEWQSDPWGNRAMEQEKIDPSESTQWFREPTGARMISNPDFPVNKENLGGILEYAKGKGIQGKDLLMAGLGKAINFPIGLASMLGGSPDNPYQKFQKEMFSEAGYGGDANKDPWGKNVRSFTDTYDVTDQWDKFAGSVLGQKYNLAELGEDGLTEAEIAQLEKMGLKGYQLNRARGLSKFNQKAKAWKEQKETQRKTLQEHRDREARQAVLDKRQAAADRSRQQTGQTTSGGRGHYDSSKDHSGKGGYGGKGRASDEARSSDLGFSDIRLKDNIELVGQSPSNINIYKFNYLNDPIVYQGVMAQEVPWASIKSDKGYLMVDYNKVDVEFKKWHRK